MTPVPPRSKSPLTQLTTSPTTCVAMITTASLHPQRRRLNHPTPGVVRAAPSRRNRIPTVLPRGASSLNRFIADGKAFYQEALSRYQAFDYIGARELAAAADDMAHAAEMLAMSSIGSGNAGRVRMTGSKSLLEDWRTK